MKPAITFVLFLLCTLPGRYGYAYANKHDISINISTTRQVEKKLEIEGITVTEPGIIHTDSNKEQLDNPFCFEEDDDQDEINKQVSASRYFIAFYYAFLLKHRACIFANRLPIYKKGYYVGSSKYIAQRVLRI